MSVLHNPRAGQTPSQIDARKQKRSFEVAILKRAADLAQRIGAASASEAITEPAVSAVIIPISQDQATALPVEIVPVECNAVFVSADAALDLGAAVDPAPVISIDRVQRAIAREYGVTRMDLISPRRTKDIVLPRQIAMYLARQMTPRSLPEIARRFGNRDHTTAIHAVRKIAAMVEADPAVADRVSYLKARISSGAGI
jgi:hypothetical protein